MQHIPGCPACRSRAMEWPFLLVRVKQVAHWQLCALPLWLGGGLQPCDARREFSSSGKRSSTSQQGVSQETCWKLQSLDVLLLGNLLSVFLPPHSSSEVRLFALAPQAGEAEVDFPFRSYRRGKENPNQLEQGCTGREGSWEGRGRVAVCLFLALIIG